jgi:magnesium transporter
MPYDMDSRKLVDVLTASAKEELREIIRDIHPADILEALEEYEGDRADILSKLPEETIAAVIDEAEAEEKYELLELLPERAQKAIVNEMYSDELADMLGTLDPSEAEDILEIIDQEEATEVKGLLSYQPDTAGGIMATEFISVQEEMTVGETLKYLQKEAPDAETAYYLYVLDRNGVLKGVVALRDLVVSSFDVNISEIMHKNIISIPVAMDQEEVGHLFEKYGFLTMPVVDDEDKMLGIITVDDAMDVLREENTEDILRLAGVSEGEKVSGTVFGSVRKRLPWLFINLLTAMLAASTVSLFEGTIARVVALAAFMPIVAGMGGNTGTQTLTIIVRGIALGELSFENAKKVLAKEIGVGLMMGLSIGTAVTALGWFWENNAIFGLVIGLAMLMNMAVATVAGFVVPMVLKKLRIDPALASSVFVTTVTDVLGFFFFLGLATVFITYLV